MVIGSRQRLVGVFLDENLTWNVHIEPISKELPLSLAS